MISFPLYHIQNLFQGYLNNQAINANTPESTNTMESLTMDTLQISAAKRLEIYYDGYRLRLLEILANDFPKLHTLMGDEAFNTLGYLYIAAHPSKHFSARYFGQYLAQFLRKHDHYSKQPYLAEMAEFEWALGNTLDAKDDNLIVLDMLKSIPPAEWHNLRIGFHSSLEIHAFKWDIPQLWQAIENKEKPRFPEKQKEVTNWIFWRKDLQSQFRSLTKPQALILKKFQDKHCFGDICELLSEIIDPETIPTITLGFIQQCIHDGFVSKLSYV